MSSKDSPSEEPEGGETTAVEQDERGRLIVGGLVTAIGLGVLVMALAALQSNWFPESPPKQNLLWLFLLAVGAATTLFVGMNPAVDRGFTVEIRRTRTVELAREDLRLAKELAQANLSEDEKILVRSRSDARRADLEAAVRRPVLLRGAVFLSVGALLAATCVWQLGALAKEARESPSTWSQFSLAMPASPLADTTAVAEAVTVGPARPGGQPGPIDRLTASEKTSTSPPVVLTWWAEQGPAEPGFGGGALPIALGGLFIVALGVWLPHVGFAGLNTAGGAVSKLIAPVLSIGLVALGAGQQAEKTRVEADVRLAEQGLPATVGLTSVQRELRERQIANLYVLERDRLAPEGLMRIEASLKLLDDDLRAHRSTVAASTTSLLESDQALLGQIDRIRLTLRTKSNQPLRVEELGAIRTALSQIELEAAKRAAEGNAQQCRLMEREAKAFAARVTELEAQAKENAALRRSAPTRLADWWKGAPKPSDGSYEDRTAADLRQRHGEIVRRHQTFCPEAARIAELPEPKAGKQGA